MFLKKISEFVSRKPLKRQMIVLFLPVTVVILITIGICSYIFELVQVKSNAAYQIESTLFHTASILDDKLFTIFSQLSKFCDSTPAGNLIIDNYDEASKSNKFNDIIACYRYMDNIYYTYNEVIHSLYFRTNGGTLVQVYKDLSPADNSLDMKKWFETYKGSPYGYYWRNLHKDEVFKTPDGENVLSVIRNIGNEHTEKKAVVVFNLKPSYFLRAIENAKISEHGYLMLVSNDGFMMPQNSGAEYRLKAQDLRALQAKKSRSGSFECVGTKNHLLSVSYRKLETNGWMIAAVAPERDYVAIFSKFRYVLMLIILFIICIYTVLCNLFAESIAKPITALSSRVKRFENGDDQVDLFDGFPSENEIGTLAAGLSSLRQSVNNLLEQVKQEQIQKSKVELLALQAQIKPHFLYNTLASIRHLVALGDMEQAGKMCSALENFYRIGISDGREIITVWEEAEHVEHYLSILQMRYNKDFDYNIEIDEDLLSAKILKLTLQPIIENAVYHGIKAKEGKGTIILTGRKEGETAVFQIYDDGVGMTPEQLSSLRRSLAGDGKESFKNFGIRNVSQRLKLYFGSSASLEIESAVDVYTQVTIKIPWISEVEDNAQAIDCGR